ncbi:MAG: rod shape-determining protein MreD [Actinomycetota bacterium]|nr:rod shape-determining protein MreD [Actinomycetota bacterium]
MSTHATRPNGIFAEMGLARIAAVTATVVVAVTLQSTVLARLTLLGVIPQLILVVVVCLAYTDGERVGVVTGFFGGLLQDLLLPQSITGLTALVYTLVAFTVGMFRIYAPQDSVLAPVFAVAVATTVAEFGYATMAIMLGQEWVALEFTIKVAGLVILYNTLLTPFVYPLVRRVANRYRPEKVYRW